MNFGIWLLVFLNIVLFAGFVFLFIRIHRPVKDDPRLSKGLQLLQSKISVLEDLSDRTDNQVNQLIVLMEKKCKSIQEQVIASDKQLAKIDQSMQKSLEIAKIFQDRIPHQEIMERQNTIKYVKAARLAHQGVSTADIMKELDLNQAEAEFISKVNREQLSFSEENLPAWLQPEDLKTVEEASAPVASKRESILNKPDLFDPPKVNQESLKKLEGEFRRAVQNAEQISHLSLQPTTAQPQQAYEEISLPSATPPPVEVEYQQATNAKGKVVNVKPVLFPKIEMPPR